MNDTKTNDVKQLTKSWLVHAIGGLILTGFGLSLLGEAIILKLNSSDFLSWGAMGTLALVVFNSGLCLVVRAGSIQQKIKDLDRN